MYTTAMYYHQINVETRVNCIIITYQRTCTVFILYHNLPVGAYIFATSLLALLAGGLKPRKKSFMNCACKAHPSSHLSPSLQSLLSLKTTS